MRNALKAIGILMSMGMTANSWAIGGANIGDEVPSARAAGQGYTGIAGQNDDPTVAWSNAAGIVLLPGTQFTVGGTYENIRGKYESPSGTETKERVTNVVVPNMSLTHTFSDGQIGLGIAVQTPYGLETHWGDGPLRYVATDSRLATTFISPSVSAKFDPTFTLGAGFDFVDASNAQLDRHISNPALNTAIGFPSGSGDSVASLKGDGTGWGGHAGFIYMPTDKHSIGVTYHSQVTIPIDGRIKLSGLNGAAASPLVFGGSEFTANAETEINLPENVQVGYSYKPTTKWMLEADAAWYRWSQFKSLAVQYKGVTSTQQSVLNNGNPVSQDLRDAWSFATGTNYKFNDHWQFRGGFWYEPWAQHEDAFTPAYIDLSRYGLTGGAGYAINSHLSLDLAYSAIFTHTRTITNSVGLNTAGFPQADISGTYKDFAHVIALNVTYKFGSK